MFLVTGLVVDTASRLDLKYPHWSSGGFMSKKRNSRKKRKPNAKKKRAGAPTISLCMIVKNEERDLPRCLESARALVDEIIVVDTGSVDKTREVAERFGARVYDYTWRDDFAAARNHSIARASKQWILFLDADEELEVSQHGAIKKKLRERGIDGLSLLVESKTAGTAGSSVHYVVRLFRNFKGIRFRGPIHESIDARGLTFQFSSFRIYHYGYILDRRGRNKKIEREEDILLGLTRDDPGTLEWFMYLFRNYLNQSRYRDVINVYDNNRAHIDDRRDNLFFPVVQYLITVCYFNLEEMSQVQERLVELLGLYPDSLDFNFLAGLYCNRMGDLVRARVGFETYLELSDRIESDPKLRFGQQLIFNEGNQRVAKNFLARIHTDQEEYNSALQILDELLQEDEENLSVLMNIIQVHRAMGDAEGVKRSCKQLLQIDPDNRAANEYLEESAQAAYTTPERLIESELVEAVSLITKAHLQDDAVDRGANVHLCFLGALAQLSRGAVLQPFCCDASLALAHAAQDVRFFGLVREGVDSEAIVEQCGSHFLSNCLFSNASSVDLPALAGAFDTLVLLDTDLQGASLGAEELEHLAAALRPGGQLILGQTQKGLTGQLPAAENLVDYLKNNKYFSEDRQPLWPAFRELRTFTQTGATQTGATHLESTQTGATHLESPTGATHLDSSPEVAEVFNNRPVIPALDSTYLVSFMSLT